MRFCGAEADGRESAILIDVYAVHKAACLHLSLLTSAFWMSMKLIVWRADLFYFYFIKPLFSALLFLGIIQRSKPPSWSSSICKKRQKLIIKFSWLSQLWGKYIQASNNRSYRNSIFVNRKKIWCKTVGSLLKNRQTGENTKEIMIHRLFIQAKRHLTLLNSLKDHL